MNDLTWIILILLFLILIYRDGRTEVKMPYIPPSSPPSSPPSPELKPKSFPEFTPRSFPKPRTDEKIVYCPSKKDWEKRNK